MVAGLGLVVGVGHLVLHELAEGVGVAEDRLVGLGGAQKVGDALLLLASLQQPEGLVVGHRRGRPAGHDLLEQIPGLVGIQDGLELLGGPGQFFPLLLDFRQLRLDQVRVVGEGDGAQAGLDGADLILGRSDEVVLVVVSLDDPLHPAGQLAHLDDGQAGGDKQKHEQTGESKGKPGTDLQFLQHEPTPGKGERLAQDYPGRPRIFKN